MNTTSTPTTEAIASTQQRIQRAYKVCLTDPTAGAVVETATVNLSYELDDQLNAINRNHEIIEAAGLAARTEAFRRLKKLAAMGETHITSAQVEANEFTFELVRSTFIEVPLDADGKPIPKRGRKS